jgi:hypothetical protein
VSARGGRACAVERSRYAWSALVDACFWVRDIPRTAIATPRSDWAGELRPDLEGLGPAERSALGQAWLDDALAEHASIAAFSRFVMQLLALGASADLVREAQAAMADEVMHAKLCFGLASVYHGAPLGPGPLSVHGAMQRTDMVEAVIGAVREGCIGETLAALQAEAARDAAGDAAVRVVLDRIATDEARHAVLAWRFVAWAIGQGGDPVRAAAADAFVRYGRAARTQDPGAVETAVMREHGRLPAHEQAEVIARAIAQVIRPSAAALLEVGAADLGLPTRR